MNKEYLINQVERFCQQYKREPSEVYKELGALYQSYYGINICLEAENTGCYDICTYLENKGEGFIDRYIILLNILKRTIDN